MNTAASSRHHHRASTALFATVMLVVGTGCQTFSLSEDDFRRQQHGQMVDYQVGSVVDAVGTLGYYGTVIGTAVAETVHK